ncbi:hypothetical protein GCM10009863_08410 [Streptomyces axinellae]|uniref:Uncharacterized protein n=1 Tax=Streptomyces axinellae TaxID=552788 RepID=A0ABN3PRQ9_9ACTN
MEAPRSSGLTEQGRPGVRSRRPGAWLLARAGRIAPGPVPERAPPAPRAPLPHSAPPQPPGDEGPLTGPGCGPTVPLRRGGPPDDFQGMFKGAVPKGAGPTGGPVPREGRDHNDINSAAVAER